MKYIDNKLTIEKVSIQNIAKKFDTPTYGYSYNQLKKNITSFAFKKTEINLINSLFRKDHRKAALY